MDRDDLKFLTTDAKSYKVMTGRVLRTKRQMTVKMEEEDEVEAFCLKVLDGDVIHLVGYQGKWHTLLQLSGYRPAEPCFDFIDSILINLIIND